MYTADYWHEWLSRGEFPDHPWRSLLERSALTLKALQYAPTGAIVHCVTFKRAPSGDDLRSSVTGSHSEEYTASEPRG